MASLADWERGSHAADGFDYPTYRRGSGTGIVVIHESPWLTSEVVDPVVIAPVVAQPAVPLPIGRRRAADLNLSASDLEAVRSRVDAGCPVLGVRYRDDWITGTRFETLRSYLGDGFIAVELEGHGHATLTDHQHPDAVDAVVTFFRNRLLAPS